MVSPSPLLSSHLTNSSPTSLRSPRSHGRVSSNFEEEEEDAATSQVGYKSFCPFSLSLSSSVFRSRFPLARARLKPHLISRASVRGESVENGAERALGASREERETQRDWSAVTWARAAGQSARGLTSVH